jgi:hypothetical protein
MKAHSHFIRRFLQILIVETFALLLSCAFVIPVCGLTSIFAIPAILAMGSCALSRAVAGTFLLLGLFLALIAGHRPIYAKSF